jgi:hypothetical protein
MSGNQPDESSLDKAAIIRRVAQGPPEGIKWSRHAQERADRRGIDREGMTATLADAELIEDYPEVSGREPDCLMLCWVEDEPIHAVVAILDDERILVVTVYKPDAEEWSDDFRERL